jgi:predicted Rossmann-fold nucleotide-binding protein
MPPKDAPMPKREFHRLEDVQRRLADGAEDWGSVILQDVDLRVVDADLGACDLAGCHFLGCEIGPAVAARIAASELEADPKRRCVVFPRLTGLSFNPYRGTLYAPEELLGRFPLGDDPEEDRAAYAGSVDWQTFLSVADWRDGPSPSFALRRGESLDLVLARRLHDTAIADALEDLLQDAASRPGARGVVAIMGGHNLPRREKEPGRDATYAQVALLAWQLTRLGYLLVSGGGPGAMEACNLGAYFASRPEGDLRAAIRILESFPAFVLGRSADWLRPAMAVRRDYPHRDADEVRRGGSLGIPTWHYGHEPPNAFATHIAKYFENSVREEGLLAIATEGVIFAPGNAGTVQEIFQDACQNYYRTYGPAAPMVLLDRDYWVEDEAAYRPGGRQKPVTLLLRQLAAEKGFTDRVRFADSPEEAVAGIVGKGPTTGRAG